MIEVPAENKEVSLWEILSSTGVFKGEVSVPFEVPIGLFLLEEPNSAAYGAAKEHIEYLAGAILKDVKSRHPAKFAQIEHFMKCKDELISMFTWSNVNQRIECTRTFDLEKGFALLSELRKIAYEIFGTTPKIRIWNDLNVIEENFRSAV